MSSPMQAVSEGSRWMLRFDPGEEFPNALESFAAKSGIRAGAVLMGIGQLSSAKVGFWDGSEYRMRELRESVELISLQGSIAEAEDRPSIHLHAALGTREHTTVSGHLMAGVVGPTAEVLVEAFPTLSWGRAIDEETGLRRLDLKSRPPR